jgi:gas vesicle protein
LEQTDELIEEEDLREIETVNKRTKAILDQIYSLVSTAQETKVELGKNTSREIRQWKKEIRDRYMPWVNEMNKLSDFLAKTQASIAATRRETYRRRAYNREVIRDQERQMPEEKFQAEL